MGWKPPPSFDYSFLFSLGVISYSRLPSLTRQCINWCMFWNLRSYLEETCMNLSASDEKYKTRQSVWKKSYNPMNVYTYTYTVLSHAFTMNFERTGFVWNNFIWKFVLSPWGWSSPTWLGAATDVERHPETWTKARFGSKWEQRYQNKSFWRVQVLHVPLYIWHMQKSILW